MGAIIKDLAFGLRQLRLNPMFTAVAVLSLALGIGANTAIFQLIDAIRLRTLSVGHPQELAYIDFTKDSIRSGWGSTRSANFTSAQWDSLIAHQQAFSGLVAWSAKNFNLAQGGKAHYAEGLSSTETSSTFSKSRPLSAARSQRRTIGQDAALLAR